MITQEKVVNKKEHDFYRYCLERGWLNIFQTVELKKKKKEDRKVITK